jgi:hypothetical protein
LFALMHDKLMTDINAKIEAVLNFIFPFMV